MYRPICTPLNSHPKLLSLFALYTKIENCVLFLSNWQFVRENCRNSERIVLLVRGVRAVKRTLLHFEHNETYVRMQLRSYEYSHIQRLVSRLNMRHKENVLNCSRRFCIVFDLMHCLYVSSCTIFIICCYYMLYITIYFND